MMTYQFDIPMFTTLGSIVCSISKQASSKCGT